MHFSFLGSCSTCTRILFTRFLIHLRVRIFSWLFDLLVCVHLPLRVLDLLECAHSIPRIFNPPTQVFASLAFWSTCAHALTSLGFWSTYVRISLSGLLNLFACAHLLSWALNSLACALSSLRLSIHLCAHFFPAPFRFTCTRISPLCLFNSTVRAFLRCASSIHLRVFLPCAFSIHPRAHFFPASWIHLCAHFSLAFSIHLRAHFSSAF